MALTSSQLLAQVKKQIHELSPTQVKVALQSGQVHYLVDVR